LHSGQFTAIPRSDEDLFPHEHIQAIANTAAFQMPTVEQGGGSLRMALAQRATSVEVLRLLISMGPIESMHFQTWHEKAGQVRPLIDPTNGLTFPDLNCGVDPNTGARGAAVRQMFQTNLIMPEPCPFISTSLPACSVVRPTNTTGAATGALKFLTAMGLFIGQSPAFFTYLTGLATAAERIRTISFHHSNPISKDTTHSSRRREFQRAGSTELARHSKNRPFPAHTVALLRRCQPLPKCLDGNGRRRVVF
jgi:hypothetical protein